MNVVTLKNIFVTVMAENRDTITPTPSVKAKPLIKEVPNQKRMIAVIMLDVLESRIENQAREKPCETASVIFFPERNSSFTRSKISTLASTAIPIEIMKPAIPAAVKVTGRSLKSVNTMAIKIQRERIAISPGKRYQSSKKRTTNKNPITAAFTPAVTACSPRVAQMVCLEIRVMGTGSAPEFNLPTNIFASVGVKDPEITAWPLEISSRTTGVVMGEPSKYMATILSILFFVISAKSLVPVSSNWRLTVGSRVFWLNSKVAFFRYLPVSSVDTNCDSRFKTIFPSSPTVASWGVSLGASILNSKSGVCPIMAVAFSTSVTPGKSTMS